MSQKKYVIGVDFGTLSGRAVLVDTSTGEIISQKVLEYAHGVMEALPGGKKLPSGWSLQHPTDYLSVLTETIPHLLSETGTDPSCVVSLGCDFTSCTLLPAAADGTPLCSLPEFHHEPHAYVKLWKHHSAYKQAEIIEERALKEYPELLKRYGGKVSAQWMLPKVLEMLKEAPQVYDHADLIMEASDWITYILTGNISRNTCCAGFKSFWNPEKGYPGQDFFEGFDKKLASLVPEKLRGELKAPWEAAGLIKEDWARRLGLNPGTVVAAGTIDAHAAVPGAGVAESGTMLLIMGTSGCHMMLSEKEVPVKGICGSCRDSIIPGYYGYEAGQASVGDMLDWFVRDHAAAVCMARGEKTDTGLAHKILTKQAENLKPGESGIVALDWWNGQRTPLVDEELTGAFVGLTMRTTPAAQYRALMEAAAYGTRRIVEVFEDAGIKAVNICACGGISKKNLLMMQIFADVLGRTVRIAASDQCSSLGAAVLAAAAAGVYGNVQECMRHMVKEGETVYVPDAANSAVYSQLYGVYRSMSDYYTQSGIMHRLSGIKAQASAR